jgi:general secretion pathway protein K
MRQRPALPTRQRGVAVITAMLVVTIATLLAVQLVWETSLDLRRTEDMVLWDQAQQYAFGAESWAADILRKDLQDDAGEAIDHLDENWALQVPVLSIEGGFMEGRMVDMQGLFNLNNLVNARGEKEEKALTHFRRLLEVLEIQPDAAARIVAGTVDWIDRDTVAEFDGAEDDTYTSRIPGHRAANFWFTSESELLAIEGMTPEIYGMLSPFVAALPPGTKINLNTAPRAVLRSLQTDIDDGGDDRWEADRQKEPCRDPVDLSITIDPDFQNFVGCASSHFGLRIHVRIGTTDLSMYSLLQRNGQSVVPRIRSFARELI